MTLEDQLKASEARYTKMFKLALQIMAQQDDLAEAMALGIEEHLKGHVKEVVELTGPLAEWRKIRPIPGLIT